MKIFNIKLIVIVLALFVTTSCEDYIGGNINSDPNKPSVVTLPAQTPSYQINLIDLTGGDFSRFNSMLIQQTEGVARQWQAMNQYSGLTPVRFSTTWTNVYEAVLNEMKDAKANATNLGYNHYKGMINVLEAYTIMMTTDVWGDIPYSEALNGLDIVSPKYDTQTSIYDAIFSLLTEARMLLTSPSGGLSVGSDDVLHKGDEAKWVITSHAIEARAYLKLKNYSAALSAAKKSYSSASDNLAYTYPGTSHAGQWYRFNRDRTSDLEFNDDSMGALMSSFNDPRIFVFDSMFTTEHKYMIAAFNQELITYREVQFIIAECEFRESNVANAAANTAYMNGINASMTRAGVDMAKITTYLAQATVNPTMTPLTLQRIMEEKYVAMYLQPEAYNDWRRTGFPALTPVSGNIVPVRWNISDDEILFNINAPKSVDIYKDKVGWNK